MPQLSVYISDDLWKKLRELREQQLLNVSSVCQRALQAEVRRLELRAEETSRLDSRLEEAGIDLELLARRINVQRSERYQLGFDAALEWARNASYGELKQQQNEYTYDEWAGQVLTSVPEGGEEIARRLGESRRVPIEPDLVRQGWRDAIDALWAKLSERAAPPAVMDIDDIPF